MKVTPGDSPMSPNSTYADCDGSWDMKLIGEQELSSQLGKSYPGDILIQQTANSFCYQFGVPAIYYYPNQDNWDAGNTYVRCWQQY
jgi:hypothetical protein